MTKIFRFIAFCLPLLVCLVFWLTSYWHDFYHSWVYGQFYIIALDRGELVLNLIGPINSGGYYIERAALKDQCSGYMAYGPQAKLYIRHRAPLVADTDPSRHPAPIAAPTTASVGEEAAYAIIDNVGWLTDWTPARYRIRTLGPFAGFAAYTCEGVEPAIIPWGGEWQRCCILPMWSLSLLATVPVGIATRRLVRDWCRQRPGLCLQCGYDLRAHHPGDKCPECGTVVEGKT